MRDIPTMSRRYGPSKAGFTITFESDNTLTWNMVNSLFKFNGIKYDNALCPVRVHSSCVNHTMAMATLRRIWRVNAYTKKKEAKRQRRRQQRYWVVYINLCLFRFLQCSYVSTIEIDFCVCVSRFASDAADALVTREQWDACSMQMGRK